MFNHRQASQTLFKKNETRKMRGKGTESKRQPKKEIGGLELDEGRISAH